MQTKGKFKEEDISSIIHGWHSAAKREKQKNNRLLKEIGNLKAKAEHRKRINGLDSLFKAIVKRDNPELYAKILLFFDERIGREKIKKREYDCKLTGKLKSEVENEKNTA